MHEKRVHDRKDLALAMRVVVADRTLEGTSLDISVGGVRVALEGELPFGAKVKVHVQLPSLPEPSVIDADVRWSRPEPDGRFMVGLQFQRVRARETWALNQIVRQA